ncbi:hypothetical protein ACVVDT_17860 [Salmonella enterica subsp. enterica serovar Typhimurium]|nr:hypothetical protein [Salmonella enterica]
MLPAAEAEELARIALASLGAEPVLYSAEETLAYAKHGELHLTCLSEPMGDAVIPLYRHAPPAPVSVPDAMDDHGGVCCEVSYADGWNACRAAMLQAEPVSNSDELPLDYLQGHKDGLEWAAQLAEANHPQTGDWLYDDPIDLARAIRKGPDMPTVQAGNSPVTPDGWVMVPKEPTQAMIKAWLSEIANFRGHAAGYRAALEAAPQQEVNRG